MTVRSTRRAAGRRRRHRPCPVVAGGRGAARPRRPRSRRRRPGRRRRAGGRRGVAGARRRGPARRRRALPGRRRPRRHLAGLAARPAAARGGRAAGVEVIGEPELAWRLRARPGRRAAALAGRHRHQRQDHDRRHARVDPARGRPARGRGRQRRAAARGGGARRARRTTSSPSSCRASSCTGAVDLAPDGGRGAQHRRRTTSTGTARSRPTPRPRRRSGAPATVASATPTTSWSPGSPLDGRPTARTVGFSARRRHRAAARRGRRPARRRHERLVGRGPRAGAACRPAGVFDIADLAPAGTTSPTRSPRRRWPRALRARPPQCRGRDRAGLRAYHPGPHRNERRRRASTASPGSTTRRRPTRTRRRRAWRPTTRRLDRGRAAQGRATSDDAGRATHAARLRGVVLIGGDRRPVAEALARHAPDVPRRRGHALATLGSWRRGRRGRRAGPPGDTVLLAPAARQMDHVPRLRRARRPVRRRGPGARRADGRGRPPTDRRPPRARRPRSASGFARPLATYYLLLGGGRAAAGCSAWSWCSRRRASASYAATGSSFTDRSSKQAMWVALGLPLIRAASRLPTRGPPAARLPAAGRRARWCCSPCWCPASGATSTGATRWIALGGPLQMQPRELAKIALVLVGRRPAGPQAEAAAGDAAPARAARPGGTLLVAARHARAGHGHHRHPRRRSCRPAVDRRRADAGVRVDLRPARRRRSASLAVVEPYRLARLTAFADPFEAPRARLPGRAGHLRARLGRLVGRRARREPGEVGLPAQPAHRLHLRDHRRGARAARQARRDRAVRRPRLRRASASPGGRASRSSQLAAAGVTAWIIGQALVNMGRRRPAAGHRRAAAARVLRRLRAAAHAVGARHARGLRPAERAPPPRPRCAGRPDRRGTGRRR